MIPFFAAAFNKAKDGYIALLDWIEDHPSWTVMLWVASVVVAGMVF